jgi:hypothetical protein
LPRIHAVGFTVTGPASPKYQAASNILSMGPLEPGCMETNELTKN